MTIASNMSFGVNKDAIQLHFGVDLNRSHSGVLIFVFSTLQQHNSDKKGTCRLR